ncbi:MAG: hypothetical protein PHV34_12355 [Verrucomicrobiae bacterium]|nr:hypothetical protein [Verrucomicrobiae bacterium]
MKSSFTEDGCRVLRRSPEFQKTKDEIIAAAKEKYRPLILQAGLAGKTLLCIKMWREIRREINKVAPPDALYSTPRGIFRK